MWKSEMKGRNNCRRKVSWSNSQSPTENHFLTPLHPTPPLKHTRTAEKAVACKRSLEETLRQKKKPIKKLETSLSSLQTELKRSANALKKSKLNLKKARDDWIANKGSSAGEKEKIIERQKVLEEEIEANKEKVSRFYNAYDFFAEPHFSSHSLLHVLPFRDF